MTSGVQVPSSYRRSRHVGRDVSPFSSCAMAGGDCGKSRISSTRVTPTCLHRVARRRHSLLKWCPATLVRDSGPHDGDSLGLIYRAYGRLLESTRPLPELERIT